MSMKSYQAQADDELSFDADVMLKVVEKTLDGWWLVRLGRNKTLFYFFSFVVVVVVFVL